ncbi:MAG: protease modulator HflC [Bacteroidetes bacterium]|nr:protease modulator HflC [Bacteroidota bacterium]
MNRTIIFGILIGLGAILLLSSSLFTIREDEQAIVIQFGKPVGDPITDAGLHLKAPFIQDVIRFDKRILEWDGDANEIPTRDKKYVYIDAFARWRITNPLTFYKVARNEARAQSRLDDIIDGSVRDEISTRVMEEIIRSTERKMILHDSATADPTIVAIDSAQFSLIAKGARKEIVKSILTSVSAKLKGLEMGIEVIDIQLKRINYNQQVRE